MHRQEDVSFAEMDGCSQAESFDSSADFFVTAFTFKPFVLSYETGMTSVRLKIWFASVSNHPYYGGGMKIAPNANPRDEL
ncbi:hypothetical protein PO124_10020 [Bacillus licheniformis]|nr:hypothetical protein [Bacillus licheniformis]